MEVGDKVRVVNTPDMCCGVLMQNNRGMVIEIIDVRTDEGETGIAILDDASLHWLHDLEKDECQH